MSNSTRNLVRKENSLTAKVIAEPRDLTYVGVPGGQGLGIFSSGITNLDGTVGESRNTISRLAYQIDINPGYVDAVTASDFRIKRNRFFGFSREFVDPGFQDRVERFFTAVEAGKEKLVTRFGNTVPRGQVEQLANEIESQGLNIGPCYKVTVSLNRCSAKPFDRSQRGRDGLYHRTDRTKVIWLPAINDAQLAAMIEYLSKREDVQSDGTIPADTFVHVELRRDKLGRFARDNGRRDAASGRVQARLDQSIPGIGSNRNVDPSKVDMG